MPYLAIGTLLICTCKPGGCTGLCGGISAVCQGGASLSLSSRTNPGLSGLSDSLSERAAALSALLGLSQGSFRVPSPHQTRLGEQPVSSPSPTADPQKPHGKHQGCMLRRDPNTQTPKHPRKALSARRGLFYFFYSPLSCLLSACRRLLHFAQNCLHALHQKPDCPSAPPTAPSFPLCRVRPFSWGRSRPGRDFHFSPCFSSRHRRIICPSSPEPTLLNLACSPLPNPKPLS